MNEKELIVNMIYTDEDAHYIFNVFKDNHKKGKIGFKKMRVRNLLSNKSQIDELSAAVRGKNEFRELDILLRDFAAGANFSHLHQFLLVREWYPEFIQSHMDAISHNVQEKQAPFTGISTYTTVEEAEDYYLNRFDAINEGILENILKEVKKLFETELGGLEKHLEALKGLNLLDLERFLTLAGNGQEWDILVRGHFFESQMEAVLDEEGAACEKNCQRDLTKLALFTAFLEVGAYPEGVRQKLLMEIQRTYFTFNLQLQGLTSCFLALNLKESGEIAQAKYLESQKEVKKLTQDLQAREQKASREKKRDEHLIQEIKLLKKTIKEQEQALFDYEKTHEAGQLELDKIAMLSQKEKAKLKEQLTAYENLAVGYQKLLASDYSTHQIVVVYNSPLLYAKHIYHELAFMDIGIALKEPFKAKKLLVQLVGLTGKQKKQLEKLARIQEIETKMLESVDERDLIMDIACYLKEEEGVIQHESA